MSVSRCFKSEPRPQCPNLRPADSLRASDKSASASFILPVGLLRDKVLNDTRRGDLIKHVYPLVREEKQKQRKEKKKKEPGK